MHDLLTQRRVTHRPSGTAWHPTAEAIAAPTIASVTAAARAGTMTADARRRNFRSSDHDNPPRPHDPSAMPEAPRGCSHVLPSLTSVKLLHIQGGFICNIRPEGQDPYAKMITLKEEVGRRVMLG
jgi:hypothetical protein